MTPRVDWWDSVRSVFSNVPVNSHRDNSFRLWGSEGPGKFLRHLSKSNVRAITKCADSTMAAEHAQPISGTCRLLGFLRFRWAMLSAQLMLLKKVANSSSLILMQCLACLFFPVSVPMEIESELMVLWAWPFCFTNQHIKHNADRCFCSFPFHFSPLMHPTPLGRRHWPHPGRTAWEHQLHHSWGEPRHGKVPRSFKMFPDVIVFRTPPEFNCQLWFDHYFISGAPGKATMLQSCFWLFKSTSHRLVIKSIPPETTGVMRIDQETLSITHPDYLLQPNPTFLAKKTTSHILTRLWWLFGDFVGGAQFLPGRGRSLPSHWSKRHKWWSVEGSVPGWFPSNPRRRWIDHRMVHCLGCTTDSRKRTWSEVRQLSCFTAPPEKEGWTMINKMPLRCPLKKPTSWYASWFLAPPLRAHTPSPQQCNQPPPMPWRHHKLSLPLLRSCQHHVVRHTRCCWRGGSPHVHNKGSAASRCERPIETQFCNI